MHENAAKVTQLWNIAWGAPDLKKKIKMYKKKDALYTINTSRNMLPNSFSCEQNVTSSTCENKTGNFNHLLFCNDDYVYHSYYTRAKATAKRVYFTILVPTHEDNVFGTNLIKKSKKTILAMLQKLIALC